MTGAINGILDFSKIEAGKMGLAVETFDVKAMIDELLDTVSSLTQKNGNTVTVRCAPDAGTMHGDLTKTRQILLNLLSNSSKFTTNGAITVHVQPRDIDGVAFMEFSVFDTGAGMTDEQVRSVFEPFSQADVTTTRKYGGTGLGLATVSRFCDLMGGSVTVESTPGSGSCFVVRLPADMAASAAPEVPAMAG